jgi:hypothetical protein
MGQESYTRLIESSSEIKDKKKTMQGVGTYHPLDNPDYMNMFTYLPPKREMD